MRGGDALKVLAVTLGASGSGKSFALQGLHPYVLETDDLRLKYSGPVKGKYGWRICQTDGKLVEKCLLSMLANRMAKDHTCIVDSTHSRPMALERYEGEVRLSGYQVYALDFRFTALETCLARNAARPEYKKVPEDVLTEQWYFLQRIRLPDWIKIKTVDELKSMMVQAGDMVA